MNGIEFSAFYGKRFQYNKTIINRSFIECLPIRFSTKNVTDEQMLQITKRLDERLTPYYDEDYTPSFIVIDEKILQRLIMELIKICRDFNLPQYNY